MKLASTQSLCHYSHRPEHAFSATRKTQDIGEAQHPTGHSSIFTDRMWEQIVSGIRLMGNSDTINLHVMIFMLDQSELLESRRLAIWDENGKSLYSRTGGDNPISLKFHSNNHWDLIEDYIVVVAIDNDGDCLIRAILRGMGKVDTVASIAEFRSRAANYIDLNRPKCEAYLVANGGAIFLDIASSKSDDESSPASNGDGKFVALPCAGEAEPFTSRNGFQTCRAIADAKKARGAVLDIKTSCNTLQKAEKYYRSDLFKYIKKNLQIRLMEDYDEAMVKRLLHEYSGLADRNDAYRKLSMDKLELFLWYDLTMSPTQKRYMTLSGWKKSYLEEVSPQIPSRYWEDPVKTRKAVVMPVSEMDSGYIEVYRTMSLDEAKLILNGDLGALRGHMGDLKQASSYYNDSARQVIMKFKFRQGAHLKLFSCDNLAVAPFGEGAAFIHGVVQARAPLGKNIKMASRNEGQATGLIGIKSEARGEGFSLGVKQGDLIAKEKLQSLVESALVLHGQDEMIGQGVTFSRELPASR